MIPARGLWLLLIACAMLGAGVVAGLLPQAAWWFAAAGIAAVALCDALALRRLPNPEFNRELPPVLPVGVERDVELRLRNGGRWPLVVDVHDLHPGDWPVQALPQTFALPAGREVELVYRLTPAERGSFEFAGCAVRLVSPLRLWRQQRQLGEPQRVRVFPNFAPLAALALVGAEQASRVIGAHVQRRRGEGTEFQQLREYRDGDSLRQIDWKASQRARRLISREYQNERSQQVILVLDCGRRMLAQDAGLVHFDHALNAALMVAYIALRQGDAVGLLALGSRPRFLPPQRGMPVVDRLLDGVFDLKAEPLATDYLEAATQLALRQPRRALVLLLSNVRDEDIDELALAARQLQKRHLVCVASLRELVLDRAIQLPVYQLEDALRRAATAQYLESRQRAIDALRLTGVDVLDVTCHELPSALVQHYLAIKRAGRL